MIEITKENIIEIINCATKGDISIDQKDEDLLEFGIDSIQFVQLIVFLEELFECKIPDSKLLFEEMNTATKIMAALQEALSDGTK